MCLGASLAAADEPATPEGYFSLVPVLERSCVAVRIPHKADQALAGIRWFHNDGSQVFPKLLVASGLTDVPPVYEDAVVAVENAAGPEGAWAEAVFAQPVFSLTGNLYVIFQLPPNAATTGVGQGPAFAYVATEAGSQVYVSSDGDDWSRLMTGYQLLIDPVYTGRSADQLALKSAGLGDLELEPVIPDPEVVIERTELLRPYPNPFNPATTIAFTLKEPGPVKLSIFDLRGRLVAELANEFTEVGRHELVWLGTDRQGGRVSSGVYFARMQADRRTWTQSLLLLK